MKTSNLVIIDTKNIDVILDLKYATPNNFISKPIYKKPIAMLHIDAYKALENAVKIAGYMNYKIKIFDAFRPYEAQEIMYNACPGTNYVSDPVNGIATHTRGIAIDLTLVDDNLNELDMGTEFDSFDNKAHHISLEVPEHVLKNRLILLGIMKLAGFDHYKYEWWHYQLPNPSNYPKLRDNEAPVGIM